MSTESFPAVADAEGSWINPWPLIIGGLSAAVLAWILTIALYNGGTGGQGFLLGTCVILVFGGSVSAGGAIAIQPRSSAVLAASAVVALVGALTFQTIQWDSAQLLLMILACLGGVTALITLLPRPVKRVVVSLVIIFHFGGIVTAITSPPPGTWISNQLWTYFYKPYLQFMYMNNAYHFYSPEPGPAPLLWFLVEYERNPDGTKNWRWVKVPDFDPEQFGKPMRPDHTPIWPNVEYTRRLSLVESVNQPGPVPPYGIFEELKQRRVSAGKLRGIPYDPSFPLDSQYREPSDIGKRWLSTYVRHVVKKYKHEKHPELPVTGVKLYRVIHNLIVPKQIVGGTDSRDGPFDPRLYTPFFQGDYDPEGVLKPFKEVNAQGMEIENGRDPFLYWLIPIMQGPGPLPSPGSPNLFHNNASIVNYVLVHAGVEDEGLLP